LWLTDITEYWANYGKLNLWVIEDVLSNRIVGDAIHPRMKSSLAVAALECAVARGAAIAINVIGLTYHSGRGHNFNPGTR
jgi:transposase InsO family protein